MTDKLTRAIISAVSKVSELTGAPLVDRFTLDVSEFPEMEISDIELSLLHHIGKHGGEWEIKGDDSILTVKKKSEIKKSTKKSGTKKSETKKKSVSVVSSNASERYAPIFTTENFEQIVGDWKKKGTRIVVSCRWYPETNKVEATVSLNEEDDEDHAGINVLISDCITRRFLKNPSKDTEVIENCMIKFAKEMFDDSLGKNVFFSGYDTSFAH